MTNRPRPVKFTCVSQAAQFVKSKMPPHEVPSDQTLALPLELFEKIDLCFECLRSGSRVTQGEKFCSGNVFELTSTSA